MARKKFGAGLKLALLMMVVTSLSLGVFFVAMQSTITNTGSLAYCNSKNAELKAQGYDCTACAFVSDNIGYKSSCTKETAVDPVNPPAECYYNSVCGTSGYVGDKFCKDGEVYQKYKRFVCVNNKCTSSISDKVRVDCGFGCASAVCLADPCADVVCEDYCKGEVLMMGSCVAGKCEFTADLSSSDCVVVVEDVPVVPVGDGDDGSSVFWKVAGLVLVIGVVVGILVWKNKKKSKGRRY